MQGKSVVIVGGASGLGKATTAMMLARGARVAIIDVNADTLAGVAEEFSGRGHEILAIAGDITGKAKAAALFGQAVEAWGQIDVLVNCAGIYPRVPILDITDEEWAASLTVNVVGTYNMMAAAVPHMKQRADDQGDKKTVAGRIVNISSVDAFKAHPQNAHYAATKAAVVSLTRSFAMQFAPDQILINSVAPAGIATEKAKASGFMPELVAANPLGRAAEPEDIAEMILFLSSEANRYVTGENVIVSGGYIMA